MYTLRFDMRAPGFGADPATLYSAVPQMCAWAENHGGLAAVLCEHHGSEDGYLPSPLLLASAVASRTERLPLSLILILPFYNPVRLAEDIAVLDVISKGRASYIFALGYRPEEFDIYGLDLADRGRLADEKLALLRKLLAGETVVDGDRRVFVTPQPLNPGGPGLMWGGGSLAAARRAGRYGLGMLANANIPGMREAYENSARKHGYEPGVAFFPDRNNPSVVFVAEDVEQAWAELGEHLLHDARTYASWNPGDETTAGFSHVDTVEELRETGKSHVIITVEEAISRVRAGQMLALSPLCGGVPPELAWPYLKRVGDVVLPEAASVRSVAVETA
ncbi:LLM class flavin-dependent oxidoreductase [Mycobacterium vicinigordonae]|uniref:LLM class flavin-dependent oxidoreductase n=1 Tax=Mycobacterium vicinigordonae TaxID=1719132 RepID=A0A7D6HRI3_9MYCO|nr:LLM class flavin-dependent oxidoreductase [Mycobacterium vicinigordonae]QLL05652.1 LLM class flavin-dependent oxidoreductase [Mycobacterium vicinigordonae]